MKIFKQLLITAFASLIIFSCSNNKEANLKEIQETLVEEQTDESPKYICTALDESYIENHFSFNDNDFSFSAPASTTLSKLTHTNSNGEISEIMNLEINTNNDFCLSIKKFNSDINQLKQDISNDKFNQLDEIIIDTDSELIYKWITEDNKPIFHLARIIEKGDYKFLIYTDIFSEHTYENIEYLYPIAHSII